MSPRPEELYLDDGREIFLAMASENVWEAMEQYNKLYPAGNITRWNVVGLVVESDATAEIVHPLLNVCREGQWGLEALGGYKEQPILESATLEGKQLKVWWGPKASWWCYQLVSYECLPVEPGNYFLWDSFLVGDKDSFPEMSISETKRNLQRIATYFSNEDHLRMYKGILEAMGCPLQ